MSLATNHALPRSMFRPRIIIPVLAFVGLIGAGLAAAAPPTRDAGDAPVDREDDGADGGLGAGRWERICPRLQCSDEQAAKLSEIARKTRDDLEPMRAQMKVLRRQLASEWVKDAPDPKVLAGIHAKIDGTQDAMRARTRSSMMEVHDVLDGAQREKLREMIAKRGRIGGGRHGGHGGHGTGGKHDKHEPGVHGGGGPREGDQDSAPRKSAKGKQVRGRR